MALWLRNWNYTMLNGKYFYKNKEIPKEEFMKVRVWYKIKDAFYTLLWTMATIILCYMIGTAI